MATNKEARKGDFEMKKKISLLSMALILSLFVGALLHNPHMAYADASGVYQVNGKYTISATRLVTKCKLETADSTLKKKKRVYKITKKTKFQKLKNDFSKVTLKGKKRAAMIKKLQKKRVAIQFTQKKGKVTAIWIVK